MSVLLPQLAGVEVERIEQVGGVLRISARTASSPVACPSCGSVSSRVHSRYERRLADTAVGGQRTAIVLEVRRLFCDEPDCDRRTFAEQVQGLTFRYGRRTPVLRAMLEKIAVALAGRVGARLGQVYGTITIDCETGSPLDLLAGRDARPLADWLTVCRSKIRFRAVTWCFAAGSSPRLGPSRGDAVAALPVGAVLARRACGAGSI